MARQLAADSSAQPTTLVRESSPPGASTASPVPQIIAADNDTAYLWRGENGAGHVIAAGFDGTNHQKISVDTNGLVKTVASKYTFTKTESSTEITAGNSQTFTLASSAGYLNYVYYIGFRVVDPPDGAGSGTHAVTLYWGDSDEGTFATLAMAPTYSVAYNASIAFSSSGTSTSGVFIPQKGPLFVYGNDDDQRCRVYYLNNTDVSQSNARVLYLGYVEVPSL